MSTIPFLSFFGCGTFGCFTWFLWHMIDDGWNRKTSLALWWLIGMAFMLTVAGSIYMGNDPLPQARP